MDIPFYVHPTAEVSPDAQIGTGTRIWRQAHVREYAQIGEAVLLVKEYISIHMCISVLTSKSKSCFNIRRCYARRWCFCWPPCLFHERYVTGAITPDGKLKSASDWEMTPIPVKYGSSCDWCRFHCSSVE